MAFYTLGFMASTPLFVWRPIKDQIDGKHVTEVPTSTCAYFNRILYNGWPVDEWFVYEDSYLYTLQEEVFVAKVQSDILCLLLLLNQLIAVLYWSW